MLKRKNIAFGLIVLLCLSFLAGCSSPYVPYDYDVTKYITLGEYKGIACEFIDIGVTDADMQQAIWSDMKAKGFGEQTTVSSGDVLWGDTVLIDFSGTIDGVSDQSLGAVGYSLTIGADVFLEDFELGLIGQTIGKSCTLEVTYPKDYIKLAYAGKTAVYTVMIHSVTRLEYPELTDEIVQEISSYQTVDEYTAARRSELEKESLADADADRETEVWEKVVANATVISYPEDAIEYLTEQLTKEFEQTAAKQEMTIEEYLADNNIASDEFNAYILNRARSLCKEEMVMHAIARQEGLEVKADEIDQLAATYAENYDFDSVKELYSEYSKELIEQTLLYQKVKDFVVASAKEVGA